MACGGCGSGSLRKQQVQRQSDKKEVVQQRIVRNNTTVVTQSLPKDRSVSLKRQALVRDDRCTKCGHPVMLVNIAGRERKQCTNCRLIQ